MALADDMAGLSADILAAWDVRTASIAGIRTDTAEELRDFGEARFAMAKEQDERLKADVAARRTDVVAMLSDLNKAHAAMAKAQRARLSEDHTKLAADGAAMLIELEQDHVAMAAELRAHLSDDRAKLAADGAAERDERLADVAVRREGWDSIAAALAKRREGAPVAPQPAPKPVVALEPKVIAPEPVPEPVVVSPEPEPVALAEPAEDVEDDLTRIRGIGPGMQAHLNAVGIFSFAKLAKADVETLRLELGDVARLARIEEWIDQAEKLTESG